MLHNAGNLSECDDPPPSVSRRSRKTRFRVDAHQSAGRQDGLWRPGKAGRRSIAMDDAASKVAPFAPVFVVEVIDAAGFAWLYGPVFLHEALKISAFFEHDAAPGREPRVAIPSALLSHGLNG